MCEFGPTVVVIGYGNPGRIDDGLGPAVADAVASWDLPGVTVESNYQLQIEDAATVAAFEVVIFADADVSQECAFTFRRLEPSAEVEFTTHAVSPASILALAGELYHAQPRAYLLGVRGHEFNGFDERLSESARADLDAALTFLEPVLRERSFEQNLAMNGVTTCKTARM